jgi:chaperone BCS1
MAIYVGLARRDQVRRLFASFYHPWEAQKNERDDSEDDKKNDDNGKRRLAELDELARRFAELVPEERLSMASLQGFLLRHKLDPQAAIDNVERFVEAEQERINNEKAARRKNKKAADDNDNDNDDQNDEAKVDENKEEEGEKEVKIAEAKVGEVKENEAAADQLEGIVSVSATSA